MAAAHHELGNLKLFLDCNRIQNDDFCETQMRMFDIPAKWNSFGWAVKVIDGHNMSEIVSAIEWMDSITDKPAVVIANTVKGKVYRTWRIIRLSTERRHLMSSWRSL